MPTLLFVPELPFQFMLAYVDPLSGSVILQVLAAGLLGGMFVVKRFWSHITVSLKSFRDRVRRR